MVQSAAVIGVGAMGGPIARRIGSRGFEVTACDRDEEALRAFIDSDVKVTNSAADCAAADVILVLVATADQVRSVVTGANGLTSGLPPQHAPVVAVMSTVGAGVVLEVRRELEPLGIRVIDAPISGGSLRAEEGRLSVIMGGAAEDVAAVRPVMECLGPQLFHCGPVGAAQTIKIVNNIIGMMNTVVCAEAYRAALDHGVSLEVMTPILDASTGRNWLSATPDEAANSFARFTSERRVFDSLMAIMRKDGALGLEVLAECEGEFPFITGLVALVQRIGDETFDNWRGVGAGHADAGTGVHQ